MSDSSQHLNLTDRLIGSLIIGMQRDTAQPILLCNLAILPVYCPWFHAKVIKKRLIFELLKFGVGCQILHVVCITESNCAPVFVHLFFVKVKHFYKYTLLILKNTPCTTQLKHVNRSSKLKSYII